MNNSPTQREGNVRMLQYSNIGNALIWDFLIFEKFNLQSLLDIEQKIISLTSEICRRLFSNFPYENRIKLP